ncbi:non-homologous end-joining DNA ligase [Ferruginibacter sp. HRS2-29]|uniref:non-homologous end-joining DNA ligase n=1 Tax=Ferruginibacter sp. HRS2-29 TaxID=2487334 RepID=UPI0020CD27DB|nr:non-homologous end-joining DNA ligase [Ferruginibacter sp. HRS2-29]
MEQKKAGKKTASKQAEKAKKNTSKKEEFFISSGKLKVPVSNPQKFYFPKEKITKKMVVEYYQSIAKYILPFLKDRPESLKRNPNGILDAGFYHKDAGENAPGFIKSFPVHSESSNKQIDYIICNDKATLAYLNNLGCIELNPWHSTIKKPDHPDYMIIDIDPSEKNNFEQVVEVAKAFKKLFDKAGARSFCKTSGFTGLHIYVPMKKKYPYEEVKEFAHQLCISVSELLPDITTLTRNLEKRGNKKIYLDYLQNRAGQTIASVYSLRPKKGATVSMPLEWKEVKKGLSPALFDIHNAAKRIAKKPSIFNGIFGPATNISACIKKLKLPALGN